ncbi:protein disulfide-isomerase precursor [Coemansia spiralis]|uniref:Protein disulfide-isomerase n=2 Tax=Coemansia TaxID=4863 RepID=A0A9W8G453_9FUNG|nr:protein disulfide isomerase A [Coemansia spiralis]KAJ2622204.1 protein disulfide-isomerase precursor [Coemansia sp. RSA 1358]KAJ2678413.1 protein disulfide-isomerase precursor [Coemansia spiralis]
MAAEAKESAVHILDSNSMYNWVDRQSLALVEFFAPWCIYCQALEPAYENAASVLKEDDVSLAKLDCTQNIALCEQLDIKGYPTLKVVLNGKLVTYNGTRQESGIVSYMLKHKGLAVKEVQPANLAEFKKSDHLVVVGYVKSKSAAELAVLEEVARDLLDDYTFGYITDKKTAKKQNIPVPSIVVYKDDDESMDIYSGKYLKDRIRKFIKVNSVPVMGELSSRTFSTYSKAGLPLGLVFYNSEELREKLAKELRPVAKEFRSVVSIALVDARVYWKHAGTLNLEFKWPAFAIQDIAKRTKYPLPQDKEVTAEELQSFVSQYANGKLEPNYKSSPIPESNDGDVFKLVSKQFNDIVFDKSKDVLILFYAPWCIHCKRLMPIYQELGRLLKGNDRVMIAQMEATLNDVPSSDPALDITGYPTVLLVRATDNVIVPYHGNRSLNSFTEFLRAHAVHSITAENNEIQKISNSGPGYMVVPKQFVGFTPKDTRHVEL